MLYPGLSHECGHEAGVWMVGVGQRDGGVQRGGAGDDVRRVGEEGSGGSGLQSAVGVYVRLRGPPAGPGYVGVVLGLGHTASLALPALAGHFAVTRLDAVLLHGQRSVHLEHTWL